MGDESPLLRYRVRRDRHGRRWTAAHFEALVGQRIPFPLHGRSMTGVLTGVEDHGPDWLVLWFDRWGPE